jgi:GNAT superfamily N-acetyltransferase
LAGFVLSLLVANRGDRMAYVPDFGHGTVRGQEYDLYRRMYAQIADWWLANGCFVHGITLYPNESAASQAWISLGFGLVVMGALREIDPASEVDWGVPPGVHIRRVNAGEVDLVVPLELGLSRHLAASPAFLPLILDERRTLVEKWLAEERHVLWLASRGGKAVAYLRFEPSEQLVLPTSAETTVAITGAFTCKDLRGSGIGTALLQMGLQWADSAGYTHCSVDFESANLPGSRFWLRHFTAVTHSVMRRVDSRLAWANERRDQADLLRAFEGHTWIG